MKDLVKTIWYGKKVFFRLSTGGETKRNRLMEGMGRGSTKKKKDVEWVEKKISWLREHNPTKGCDQKKQGGCPQKWNEKTEVTTRSSVPKRYPTTLDQRRGWGKRIAKKKKRKIIYLGNDDQSSAA